MTALAAVTPMTLLAGAAFGWPSEVLARALLLVTLLVTLLAAVASPENTQRHQLRHPHLPGTTRRSDAVTRVTLSAGPGTSVPQRRDTGKTPRSPRTASEIAERGVLARVPAGSVTRVIASSGPQQQPRRGAKEDRNV